MGIMRVWGSSLLRVCNSIFERSSSHGSVRAEISTTYHMLHGLLHSVQFLVFGLLGGLKHGSFSK